MGSSGRWAGLIMTLALAGCQGPAARVAAMPVDTAPPAPDASFVDQSGKRHRLSEFKGKPIVLTEWAEWCPHCQAHLPRLQNELYRQYAGKGVAFVTVEVSRGTSASVNTFAQQQGMTMPLYTDDNGSTLAAYPLQAFPTTVVISPDFRIVGSRVGEIPSDDAAAMLQPYVKP